MNKFVQVTITIECNVYLCSSVSMTRMCFAIFGYNVLFRLVKKRFTNSMGSIRDRNHNGCNGGSHLKYYVQTVDTSKFGLGYRDQNKEKTPIEPFQID